MKTPARLLSSLGTVLLAATGVIAGGGLQATAVPAHSGKAPAQHTDEYVALGDSYAAGQGAGHYQDSICLQSSKGYPALLDAERGINLRLNASCSGDTTEHVQAELASSLSRKTTLVTLTVGGNDLNVAGAAKACLNPSGTNCAALINNALLQLSPSGPGLPSPLAVKLATTYAGIKAAAPNARVLVTGYPHLFEQPAFDPLGLIGQINGATDLLNGTIRGSAGQAGKRFHYVDVTGLFDGHGIGSRKPWINPPLLSLADSGDAFHPNAAGYLAYESAIKAARQRVNKRGIK